LQVYFKKKELDKNTILRYIQNRKMMNYYNPFMIGSKVYLRALEPEDAEKCFQWLSDPEIRIYIASGVYPNTKQNSIQFIENVESSENDVAFAIITRENNEYIGNTGLHKIDFVNSHAEFGILIGNKNYWDKGIGTEVTKLLVDYGFGILNLNKIFLRVYNNNSRGIKCYQKAGFSQEGILRQDRYYEGKYYDTIIMSILREEWEKQ
jgi:RimJ/RimL family protein N-acetyltransferase